LRLAAAARFCKSKPQRPSRAVIAMSSAPPQQQSRKIARKFRKFKG